MAPPDRPDVEARPEEAWADLRARTRRARLDKLPRWLFGAVIAGSAIWLVAGSIVSGFFLLQVTSRVGPPTDDWFDWLQIAQDLGYRLAASALAVLIGWWAVGRLEASRS